jgi:glycosyltransferase involved in cell wall biosynthesis
MHIGFACSFHPATAAPFLDQACREAALKAGGQRNAPVGNLLPALLRRGHRVTLFCLEQSLAAPLTLTGPALTVIQLPQRPGPFRATLDQFRTERAALASAIREVRPDVIHGHWTQTGHALAALDSGLPCHITVHDTALLYEWYNRGWNPVRQLAALQRLLMTARIARRARSLIAVSPDVASHLRRVFRYRGALHVIPNPLPAELYRPFREARNRRRDSAAPVFADVAAWGRIKNTTTLIRAFQRVKQRLPGARLLLFGVGLNEGGPAWSWANRHGLTLPGLEFRGPLEEHAVLHKTLADEVDFLVHMALTETFGMSMAEALSLDIPVIAGDVGGVRWALDALPGGWVKNVRDEREVAEAMLQIARAGPFRVDSAALAAWEARVAPDAVAQQLESLYTREGAS